MVIENAQPPTGPLHGLVSPPVVLGGDGRPTATLYLGDCLDILPTLGKVDAVVTDPPYGIGFDYGDAHDDDAEAYAEMMRTFVGLVSGMVGNGAVFVWQAMLNADKWHTWFPPGFRLFAACKGFVQYRPTPVQFSWDPVVFWGRCNGEPSVYAKDWHLQALAPFGSGREKIEHPCPRPVEQVLYVVNMAVSEGNTVLDPFMGSGTTGIAAARLGVDFVGVEKCPKYFDLAVRRISAALAQPSLFGRAG